MRKKVSYGLTAEYLDYQYNELNKTQKEIAIENGLKQADISAAMKFLGLQARPVGRVVNLVGQRFGNLVVKSPLYRRVSGNTFKWLCVCDCGNEVPVRRTGLVRGLTKSCGCLKISKVGSLHHAWKGYGHIPSTFICRYKSHAKRRGILFELSIDYLSDLFERQEGCCALTGVPLSFLHYASHDHLCNVSLDRIDSSLGYIEGNVWWVDKDINFMKHSLSVEEFRHKCTLVVEYAKSQASNSACR